MNDFYIYAHYKRDSDIPFYIGKGKEFRAYSNHNRSEYWHHMVNKYGPPRVTIELDNLSEIDALWTENMCIIGWGRADLREGPLTNLTNGGESNSGWVPSEEIKTKIGTAHLGKKHSKETKAKISAALSGKKRILFSKEHRANLGVARLGNKNGSNNKGKKCSEETKRKIRAAKLGKKHGPMSEEQRTKLRAKLKSYWTQHRV